MRPIAGLVLAASILAAAPVAVPATAMAAEAEGTLDLAQYRGKVVYVDFWASWCAPCRQSFAYLNRLRASYDSKDLVIVTINLDHDRNSAARFLQSNSTGLPVIYDPKGAIATRFQVSAMPTSVVIGRDGRQRFVHHGYFDNKTGEYSNHVSVLVGEHG
jgi:thiol-disulfide isomerase/thioredoxin